MPFVATQGPYALKISYDDFPTDPRRDWDNFGTMCCWHRRYNLGDEHSHDDPQELMADLVRHSISEMDIIEYVKKGNAQDIRLNYDRSSREWVLETYSDFSKKWYMEYTYAAPLKESEYLIADAIIDNLSIRDLSVLAERTHCILPLYLYDHSGITMNTSGFHCPWDSGQVGYIYASHESVAKEYGAVDEETLAKAMRLLESEVECYDYYLTGQCYGYEFYKEGVEVDSSWGYLGDLRDMQEEIEGWLPDECKGLTDDMEDVNDPIDLSDFWEYPEDEDEQEDELEDEQ